MRVVQVATENPTERLASGNQASWMLTVGEVGNEMALVEVRQGLPRVKRIFRREADQAAYSLLVNGQITT